MASLRKLLEQATPAPWYSDEETILAEYPSFSLKAVLVQSAPMPQTAGPRPEPHERQWANAQLICWLRNHADAILAIVDAAGGLDVNGDKA